MKNDNEVISEALDLVRSDKGDIFVSELEESLKQAIAGTKGQRVAVVESAIELIAEEKRKIEQLLRKVLKRDVDVMYEVKPTFLGGFRITVGDWVLDASLVYQLEKLRQNLGGTV